MQATTKKYLNKKFLVVCLTDRPVREMEKASNNRCALSIVNKRKKRKKFLFAAHTIVTSQRRVLVLVKRGLAYLIRDRSYRPPFEALIPRPVSNAILQHWPTILQLERVNVTWPHSMYRYRCTGFPPCSYCLSLSVLVFLFLPRFVNKIHFFCACL